MDDRWRMPSDGKSSHCLLAGWAKNRIKNLRVEERICCFYSGVIEDETHVLLNCPFYDDFRENLFNVAKSYTVDIMSFNNEEKILFLFTNFKKT